MKRTALAALLALSVLPAAPTPAQAFCLPGEIRSCNADFPSTSEKLIGIRGWCYLIRWAMCAALDPL